MIRGSVTGIVAGLALGLAGRPLLVQAGGRDLSPYRPPVDLVAWMLLSMLALAATMVLLTRRAARSRAVIEQVRAPLTSAPKWSGALRSVLLLGAGAAALGGLLGVGAAFAPALVALGLALLAALLVPVLLVRLPVAARRAGVLVRYTTSVLSAGRTAASWAERAARRHRRQRHRDRRGQPRRAGSRQLHPQRPAGTDPRPGVRGRPAGRDRRRGGSGRRDDAGPRARRRVGTARQRVDLAGGDG